MAWFFGNGVRLDRWVPSSEGTGWELTEELAPLENVKDYCSILSGFNNKAGYGAHDALVSAGYYDTVAALTQINVRYTTMNAFARTILASASGWGARLDVITVKGVTGAARFENVMKVSDANRPSDHNMVMADIRLP